MPRFVCLVADGFGVGSLPDAMEYGDVGANTLEHVAAHVGGIRLPNLEKWGIGHLGNVAGVSRSQPPAGTVSRLAERSRGKDTTTGHWEIAGLVTREPFALFPDGFPSELVDRFCEKAQVPGCLGNYPASGTAIIEALGEEHLRTGKPILYTSGDSVFQIAAHEDKFGLERLYRICDVARELTIPYRIGRVIARPFVGNHAKDFKRTEHRRDYSMAPGKNCLDVLSASGISVYSVGKIDDIFNHRSIRRGRHTGNNHDSYLATLDFLKESQNENALIFVNLVDFDMLYGHRRDPVGYAKALVELDEFIPKLSNQLKRDDYVVLTSDHGCDPTFKGTDHTREYVPLLGYSPSMDGRVLPDRHSFADIAASILDFFSISSRELPDVGQGFVCMPRK